MPYKFYTFLIGCIGLRIILALAAKNADIKTLRYMGLLALIPAFGFLFLYTFNLRKTGFEAGGTIWWKNMRAIHGFLYLLFSILAIKGFKDSWKIMALDVFIGLVFWYMKYYLGYFNY